MPSISISLLVSKTSEKIKGLDDIELLLDGPLLANSSIALLPLGSLNSSGLERLINQFEKRLGKGKLIQTQDLRKSKNYDKQIIISTLGKLKRNEIDSFKNKLLLQGSKVNGLILLQDSSLLN